MRSPAPFAGLTIRATLALGFTLISALWLFAEYRFTRRMDEIRLQAERVGERYIRAQSLLADIRSQILVGSVNARDALLDMDPDAARGYRDQLEATYRLVNRALDQYVPVVEDGREQQRIDQLREEIAAYRGAMNAALLRDPGNALTDVRVLISQWITPRRELVVRLAGEILELNRVAYVQQQDAIAEIYQALQRSIWQQMAGALALSLGIALFATVYASRLENRLRAQADRDARNRTDLERLSSRLVHAQEEERRSIARELHDEVGQVLTAIKVELAIAQRAIDAGDRSADLLDGARAITDGALQTVRDLSQLLRPALLDDLGLPAAVEWYAQGFGKRHSVDVDVRTIEMDERLPPDIETAAFRIIQEALTNVAKHSQATRCCVRLERLESTLRVSLQDDGVGFDPSEQRGQAGSSGLGFVGIRERASDVNGTVQIEAAPGRGTRIVVDFPVGRRVQTPQEV